MLIIIRPKETNQIAVVTGYNRNKWEINRNFRNKMREYLKDKIDDLATNSKNKNI
jgi:hypothetical protein